MKVRTLFLFLLYIVIVICLIPILLFCIPLGIREPLYDLGKAVMRLSRWILGLRLEVTGLEQVDPAKTYVFMGNHTSFIDGPLLFMLIPQHVRVILKKSIFKLPILGFGMKYVGFVPVDRKRAQRGKEAIEGAAGQMRERKYSFLIFPEGTRSRDGNLAAFRRGGFFLAVESGAPIVPVSIRGTFEIMPKGSFFVKKGRIRVTFRPPILIQDTDAHDLADLMDKVRTSIQAGLGEERI
ncbi:MAG: lysophospholipid acyltransferase family protein [Candidatus Aminicenantes bacterium]|nr:lysophospholipid acyltransferase family protein [Candidatus Aminicenantes bacterium]